MPTPQKTSDLSEKTLPVADDLLPLVDSEASPIETKNIKMSNVLGSLGADVWIVSSDASAKIKTYAQTLESVGYPVYVCTGTALNPIDDETINPLLVAGANIQLVGSNFYYDEALDFPYGFYTGHNNGVTFRGQQYGTVLNYLGDTGYALSLSAEAAVSDARTSCQHLIENLVVLAPNTTDGGILFEAANQNTLRNIWIECANGNAIRMKTNTYGSGSIWNHFFNVNSIQNTKCQLYGTNNSQAFLHHCNLGGGDPDAIYFNGGHLWMSMTSTRGITNAINRVDGYTEAFACYNDGGNLAFNGGKVRAFGCTWGCFSPSGDCDWDVSGSFNVNHRDMDFPQIQPPYDFINRGVQCDKEIEVTPVWTIEDDADASNGKAARNTVTDTTGYVFNHKYYYYNYLPRGRYLLLIRLKDTDQVANQVLLRVQNWSDTTYPLSVTPTLTASYAMYAFPFTINEDDVGDDIRIFVLKNTVTENIIYADFYKIIYLGTEWDDFTIGDGHQLLLLDDVGTLPAASVNYRGMLGCDYGAPDARDYLKICLKADDNTYSWVAVVDGGA